MRDPGQSAAAAATIFRPQEARRVVMSGRRVRMLEVGSTLALIICAVGIFFFHLGAYGLWEPDEARYAEIAREMLALHDYILPHLNYVPYIEKPPLLYWLTVLSMHFFGVNEFAARLPNALAALVGVVAVYYFVLRVFDLKRAIISGVVLFTSALYPIMAQVLTTDMLLTATITVAFFAFFLHWREGGRWCWLMYVAMALGTLTKGPVALAIPLTVGAVFLAWEGDWRSALRRFHVIPGMILIAAVCAPWFIAISIRQPDFFNFYIIGEHFRRVFDASYSHGEPFYYYLPVIFAGTLPWSIVALVIPWRALAPNPARRFCVIAATTVFIIFSIASAKLIPYVLPVWAPLAVVLGDGIAGLTEIDMNRRGLVALGLLLIVAGVGLSTIAIFAAHFSSPYPILVWPAIAIAGVVLIVGGSLSTICFWCRQIVAGLAAVAIAASAIYLIIGYGRLMAESTRSYARLARQIEQRAPDATLICYPRYIQSLPFYCHRRIILIGPETELAYGAKHSPDTSNFFFKHKADLLRLWAAPHSPVLVLDRNVLPPLKGNLGKFNVIAEDRKKIAIRRSASPELDLPQLGRNE